MGEKIDEKMGGKMREERWERKDAKARGRRLRCPYLSVWL
jgi:hypothetical protein